MGVPKRIQLSRRKGWKMPEGAVKVDRSTRWGNPIRVVRETARWAAYGSNAWFRFTLSADSERTATVAAIAVFAAVVAPHLPTWMLRGRDLGCWCKLCHEHAAGKPFDVDCTDCAPCHADVLGRVANQESGHGAER